MALQQKHMVVVQKYTNFNLVLVSSQHYISSTLGTMWILGC